MTDAYQVHEIFHSIQGEGVNAGDTATFVRLQGCPVGCEWCDAKLTWYGGGVRMDEEALIKAMTVRHQPTWIVVTGGEPLLYDLDLLFEWCREVHLWPTIQVETSGVYPYKGELRPDWTCVSPKYTRDYAVADNVMVCASELKYVVDEHFDPGIVATHLEQWINLPDPPLPLTTPAVVLMPEGSPPRPAMVARTLDLLREHPLWRFGPRLQYAYPEIAGLEGDTNQIIPAAEARARVEGRVSGR